MDKLSARKKNKMNIYNFLLRNIEIKNWLQRTGLLPIHINAKLQLYEQFCDIVNMNPNKKKSYAVNMVARINKLSPMLVTQTIDKMNIN